MRRRTLTLALTAAPAATLSLAAALLSGCTSLPASYTFDAARDEGLVLGSITYDSSLGQYSLLIASSGRAELTLASVGYALWPPLGPLHDDQLGAKGGTFALALPAGEHRVVGWQIKQGYRVSRNTSPVSIPFTVQKGGSTYLGNLHISEHWDNNRLRDRSVRDLPVLKARHPAVASAPLAFAIQKDTDLERFGGGYASRMQLPQVIIVPVGR